MVRAGMSLPALQQLMGHSQIATTMLYYLQTADIAVKRPKSPIFKARTLVDST